MLNAVLGDGMSSRLFLRSARRRASPTTSARASPTTPTPARSRSRPAWTRSSSGRRSRRSSSSSRACATSPCPAEELAKAKAYLSGGLELRMDETRHLASWIGGQEALHDRVLTLDEALAAVAAVDVGGHPGARRPSCSATRCCGWRSSPRPRSSARPRPQPAAAARDVPTARARRHRRPRAYAAERDRRRASGCATPPAASARSRWRAPSSRRWPAAACSTTRRSSTWPRCAGGRATCRGRGGGRRLPRGGRETPLALVIAAEAHGRPRPARARRAGSPAGRIERADGRSTPSSPGMPRELDLAGDPARGAGPSPAPADDARTPRAGRPAPDPRRTALGRRGRGDAGAGRARGGDRPPRGRGRASGADRARRASGRDRRQASRRRARRRRRPRLRARVRGARGARRGAAGRRPASRRRSSTCPPTGRPAPDASSAATPQRTVGAREATRDLPSPRRAPRAARP